MNAFFYVCPVPLEDKGEPIAVVVPPKKQEEHNLVRFPAIELEVPELDSVEHVFDIDGIDDLPNVARAHNGPPIAVYVKRWDTMYAIAGRTCWPIGNDIPAGINSRVMGPGPEIRLTTAHPTIPLESGIRWENPDHPHSDELRDLVKSLPADVLGHIRENPQGTLAALYLEVALETGKQIRKGEPSAESFKAGDAISGLMQYYQKCKE